MGRLVTAAPALIFAAALFAFAAWAIRWSIRDARRTSRIEDYANQHGKEDR